MTDRPSAKPEIASQKRVLKLAPAIGDWTTYRPPKALVKKVKSGLYGFDRLSKDEMSRIMRIHYRFVQEFLLRLKIDLAMGVEFYACQVEQTTYLNFLRSLSGPLLQGKITVANIHEGIQLYFDLNLTNSVINHALGSQDTDLLSRGLTEAEQAVFNSALTEYLPLYTAAFENTLSDPAFTIISAPDLTLDPSINTSASFVIFSAEISLNDNPPGRLTFGYLANSLKSLLKDHEAADQDKPLNFARLSPAVLNRIRVAATAFLGRTSLLTSEIHRLETGDVVSLDTPINSALLMALGNFLKVRVQPGLSNKKKAVRLTGFREEEEMTITPPLAIAEEKKPAAPATLPPPPSAIPAAPPELPPAGTLTEELPEEKLELEEFPEEEFAEEDLFEEELPAEGTETGEGGDF